MPFKSKSQIRYFGHLVHTGQMSKAEFEEWMRKTIHPKKLPERVKKSKIKRRR